MRTRSLAAVTLVFAIAACSDVASPLASGSDAPSMHLLSHGKPALKGKLEKCDIYRWDKRGRFFFYWGWHGRHRVLLRGFRGSTPCDPGDTGNGGDGGEAETGTISGTVTNDFVPEAGYPVYLLLADGSVAATTTTDAAGTYTFEDVPVGSFLVCEDNPFTEARGYLGQTAPKTGGSCPQPPYGKIGFSLTLTAGATLSGNAFSNMHLD